MPLIERQQPQRRDAENDLRRTAATLMTRAGVLPHVVEKVLNHVTPGIAGVYQHHNWLEEKRDAVERLSRIIQEIIISG